MTSPPRAKRTAKRAQISRAARALFLSQGVAGTSMDAVTAEAGVSKQTLYSYFPTKLDLLSEVLITELDKLDLAEARVQQLESPADFRDALLQFASGFTTAILRPDSVALLRLILGEAFRIPELRHIVRVGLPARILTLTTELVRAAANQRIIDAPNPAMTARMFVGPLMTFVALDGLLGAADGRPPSRDELEFIVDAVVATVSVTP